MTSPATHRDVRLAALRVPLAVKVLGANAGAIAILVAGWLIAGNELSAGAIALCLIVIAVHAMLVLIALRPIRDLESVASRLWQGDYAARVTRSSVADTEVLRIGAMFNILLDGLAADRARMRELAADAIAAGDRERAGLARELHDSVAQHLAALQLELSAAARDASDSRAGDRLRDGRDAVEVILHEVRSLSHELHPGVLDDFGLEAAVRRIGRDLSNGRGLDVDVNLDGDRNRLPRAIESALYRVAQEAVRNAALHSGARHVRISLHRAATTATLNVHDDGVGFDLAEAETRRPGLGLTSMRERVELLNGRFDVKTAKGSGTTISATVPLDGSTRIGQY